MIVATSRKTVILFKDANNKEPIKIWLDKLDSVNRARINNRLLRLELGLYGDYKKINKDIYELRFDFSSGYRMYFAELNNIVILLLCGGDKKTQQKDIKKAMEYFIEYKEREMANYRSFNEYLIKELQNPKEAKAFLEVSIEEYEKDGNTAAFLLALRIVAEAQGGISKLAEKSDLNKQNLYKILTGKTTPKFDTTLAIMKGLGFKFSVESMTPWKDISSQ